MDLIATAAGEAGGGNGGGAAGGGKLSPFLKAQLPRMADLGNVPRNEKKFKNFVSNSLRVSKIISCLCLVYACGHVWESR